MTTSHLAALDRVAAAWLGWAWGAALCALVVLLLLAVLRPLLARRVSAHAWSWLWLLPLVPLVAPPLALVVRTEPAASERAEGGWTSKGLALVEAPRWLTDGPEAQTHDPSAGAGPAVDAASVTTTAPAAGAPSLATPAPATPPVVRIGTLLVLLWWGASAVLLVRVARRHLQTRALVRSAVRCDDAALRRRFDRLAREAGLERRVPLLFVDGLASPAAAGLVRPRVLLPADLALELEPAALDWILRHELAHVRRRDVLVATLVELVRAVWFPHPAVHVAPAQAARARELACDEAALARGRDADGPCAARALLHVLERRLPRATRAAGAVPLTHPESLERRRIMTLLDPSRRPSRGLAPLSTAALVGASLALLASGVRPAAAAPADVPAEPPAVSAPAPAPDDAPAVVQQDRAQPAYPTPEAARTTLRGALRYLVAEQQPDGRWRAVAGKDDRWVGELDDVGVTGAALLALAAAPEAERVAGVTEALSRGVAWLSTRQDDERGVFALSEPSFVAAPSHALALLGFVRANEALGRDDDPAVLAAVRQAVAGIEAARNPYLGWRYGLDPDGDNDSVITGWMLLALDAARDLGVEASVEAVRGGMYVFDQYYDEDTGRMGYNAKGVPTSRLQTKHEDYPGTEVEFPTAVALAAQLAWGADPLADGELFESAALLVTKAPVWSRGRGTIDSYYWAFGTLALQPLGGLIAERWNRSLFEALVPHADEADGDALYWEAMDAWHEPGSEVAMTAMCALALAEAL